MRQRLLLFGSALALFAADRASKVWIEGRLGPFDTWVIIPGFCNFIHAENPGMAFSLLADASEFTRTVVLTGFAGAVLAMVAVMLWQAAPAGKSMQRAALTLVLGGALGNLYDRVTRGSVTDFIDVYVGSAHWPTFNVADSAITVGAILLGLEVLFERGPKHEAAKT